jgi:hypothetical protein
MTAHSARVGWRRSRFMRCFFSFCRPRFSCDLHRADSDIVWQISWPVVSSGSHNPLDGCVGKLGSDSVLVLGSAEG